MESIRKGLRNGDLEKDTYQRIVCGKCEKPLKTTNDPETITTIRTCPDCGQEWKELR